MRFIKSLKEINLLWEVDALSKDLLDKVRSQFVEIYGSMGDVKSLK